jgi:hypothetical protein
VWADKFVAGQSKDKLDSLYNNISLLIRIYNCSVLEIDFYQMFLCSLASLLFHVKNVARMTGSAHSKQIIDIHVTENILWGQCLDTSLHTDNYTVTGHIYLEYQIQVYVNSNDYVINDTLLLNF